MFEFVQIVLFLYALQVVGGAIAVRLKMTSNRTKGIESLDTDLLTSEVRHRILAPSRTLEKMGFELVGLYQVLGLAGDSRVYCSLLINREDKTVALAADIATEGKVLSWVEFGTEFDDGGEFGTLNSDQLGAYPPYPGNIKVRTPGLHDLHLLYKVHRFVLERDCRGRTVRMPDVSDGVAHMHHSLEQEEGRQVELGNLYVDLGGMKYRPTWKGAFLFTWLLAFPNSWFRMAAVKSQAKALLKEVEKR